MRQKHQLAASQMFPDWKPIPQPRHVPWPGTEPTTLQFTGRHSNLQRHICQDLRGGLAFKSHPPIPSTVTGTLRSHCRLSNKLKFYIVFKINHFAFYKYNSQGETVFNYISNIKSSCTIIYTGPVP